MTKVRVLEITCEPILHGGQERFILNLIKRIDDPDIVIDVMTPYEIDNEGFCSTVEEHGGTVFGAGLAFMPGKSRKVLESTVSEFLIDKKYDVVHIHSGSISALANVAKAAKNSGIPVRIVHSHCTSTRSLKHEIVKVLYGGMLKNNATDFLACSYEAGKDKFPEDIVRSGLTVVKDGIDMDSFRRDDISRKEMRERFDIAEDDFVIGHVGRFANQKNHAFLIKVFERFQERFPASRLLLVGDGELMDETKSMAEKAGIRDKVIFTGNVDDTEKYYQAMDLFLFPSFFEGFGYAVLEAIAIGLPCIISEGVPEDVMVCDRVVRLPLDDITDWVERSASFMRKGISDNREAIIRAGLSVSDTAAQMRDIYKRD